MNFNRSSSSSFFLFSVEPLTICRPVEHGTPVADCWLLFANLTWKTSHHPETKEWEEEATVWAGVWTCNVLIFRLVSSQISHTAAIHSWSVTRDQKVKAICYTNVHKLPTTVVLLLVNKNTKINSDTCDNQAGHYNFVLKINLPLTTLCSHTISLKLWPSMHLYQWIQSSLHY